MKKNNIRRIIVVLFLIIFAITICINIRGSFLEYKELGESYLSVLETNLRYKYITGGINFILIFCIMYFTTRGIKRGLKVFFDEEKKEMLKLPNKSIALIVSAIVSIIVEIVFVPKIILFASNASFEQTDGVFNLDISFYVFVEPLIKMMILYIIGIFVALIIYSAIYYIIVFNKYFDGIDKETLKNSNLIKSIIRYIRFIAIGFSIYTLITTLDIVFSNFVTTNSELQLTGAGITDVTIKIWVNIILAIIIVVSTFLATSNFKKNQKSKILKDLLLIPAYMVIMFVVMIGFDLIFVNSNEYDKEKKYIEKNISYTKNAYGINCEDEVIEYSGTITEEEAKENKNVINNAVIVSKELALENLNEDQTEKGYYTYSTAGISKYYENGTCRLVYMSPREILNTKRTYNSKTFEYTHGYGLVLTSATSTTENGGVEYVKNKIEDIDNISNPQIYYGLETNNTVIINTKDQDEYDYTDSKGKEYKNSYNGNSGLKLNFFDRLILGIKKGDVNLAFTNNVTSDSKVLINRNIIERAKLVLSASNIIYDENPYIVIDENGDIYWVLDAYTISNNYPYSTYTTIVNDGEKLTINYIRNSIKVIINSYDGNMKFYITDTTDPIAMAYRNMYPTIFEDLDSKIPESIAENLVYPKFLYEVQASMLEEYHNTKAEVLYRGDDSWEKATYTTTQSSKTVNKTLDAYYTMVNVDGEENIGLIQMYTLKNKQNLNSYLVGTVKDGVNKLKVCKLSSNESILGLTQLDSKISQDEKIQSEIDSLNVTGAKVTKNMMVIPVNNTLLYIEQVYQTKTNESNIPVLKKVIVASGNKVAIGDDLTSAIDNIVSKYASNIDTYTTEDIDGLIQSIIKANNNLSASMNSKDWELIGADVKKLQELITLLEKENENQNNNQSQTENQNQKQSSANQNDESNEVIE